MLRARVRQVTGRTKHYTASRMHDGEMVDPQRHPDPDYVEIVEEGNGYYLFHYLDSRPEACISDSWFESMEQAQRQAEFEFGITKDGRQEIP